MTYLESERFRSVAIALLTSALVVLGLGLLRVAFTSPQSLVGEVLANRLTYIYVFAATAAVFSVLGYVLGRQADELRRLSMTDPLTGLGNRRAVSRRMREEWRRAQRQQSPLSVLLIDLDGLKQINDERGHGAGDQALQAAARAIKAALRATDFGARWGGDEFAIVASDTNRHAAQRLAERLLDRMTQHGRAGDIAVTASIGVATANPAEHTEERLTHLLHEADAALYQAKTNGRNRVRVA
jgi:diguanylate cyclase (GGDEF)-like protein